MGPEAKANSESFLALDYLCSRLSLLICDATKDEPLMLSNSSDIFFCIETCTGSQLYSYTGPSLSLSYQEPLEHCSSILLYLKDKHSVHYANDDVKQYFHTINDHLHVTE